jgi:hypothetical protein
MKNVETGKAAVSLMNDFALKEFKNEHFIILLIKSVNKTERQLFF